MKTGEYLWSLLLIGVACCRSAIVEPYMDINIYKDSSGYKLSFNACHGTFLPQGPLPVDNIYVTKGAENPDSVPFHCKLTSGRSSPQLRGQWYYGTTPSGYTLSQCDPLEPGQTYQVQAGGPPFGRRVFTVKGNGDIELGAGSCP